MHDNRDDLDRLLDSALATYADPGPDFSADSGLEQRILTRLAAETRTAPHRRRLIWAVGVAAPAAAILLLFTLILHPWTHPTPTMPQQANISHQHSLAIETAKRPSSQLVPLHRGQAPPRKHRPRHRTLAARSAPLPKLDIFPTPQPLTPEEQALVNFAARASKSERESLIAAQQHADAPLRISAIQIKPLQPPAPGAN